MEKSGPTGHSVMIKRFGDIFSKRVPQMSMQLANWRNSWEEPKVVFAELGVWMLSVLEWSGQKVSQGGDNLR